MASDMGEDATKRHDRRVSLSVMAEALLHPKLDIPYFSHEPLDPLLYPGGRSPFSRLLGALVSLDIFKSLPVVKKGSGWSFSSLSNFQF